MSNQPPSPDPRLSDPAALAELLQQTSRALFDFSRTIQPGNAEVERFPLSYSGGLKYELRTYQIPDFIVDEERKLLDQYTASNWQELFSIACAQLRAVFLLLQNFDEEKEVNGSFLNQIAEHLLSRPLDMLNTLCSLVVDFAPPESEPK